VAASCEHGDEPYFSLRSRRSFVVLMLVVVPNGLPLITFGVCTRSDKSVEQSPF
jgi:hypothetical protein